MPTEAEIERMYDKTYFSGDGDWVCGFWKGGYVENEENLREEAREVLPLLGRSSGRLLEVGSAGGYFLDEARKLGFDVRGVELNEEMAAWARRKLALDVVCMPFETFDREEAYDVIVAQDVLEHMTSPHAFVSRALQLLAPGGAILIRGPLEEDTRRRTFEFLRRSFLDRDRIIASPPFHLQGFTSESFRLLMETHQLELQHFEVDTFPPALDATSVKEFAGSAISLYGHMVDKLRNKGDFMVGRAAQCTPSTALPLERDESHIAEPGRRKIS